MCVYVCVCVCVGAFFLYNKLGNLGGSLRGDQGRGEKGESPSKKTSLYTKLCFNIFFSISFNV